MNTITQKLADDTLNCFACMYLSTVDNPFDSINMQSAENFARKCFIELCDALKITQIED